MNHRYERYDTSLSGSHSHLDSSSQDIYKSFPLQALWELLTIDSIPISLEHVRAVLILRFFDSAGRIVSNISTNSNVIYMHS